MAWCAYTSFQSPFFHNNDDDDDNNNLMYLQHWFIPQRILYGIEGDEGKVTKKYNLWQIKLFSVRKGKRHRVLSACGTLAFSFCSSGWLGAGAKMCNEYFCSYHWLIVIKSCELYVTFVSWFRCRRKSKHNRDTEKQSKRKTKKC